MLQNKKNLNRRCEHDVLTEDALVVDVLDAEPEACREGAHQDVQVKEERHPSSGLVLRHRRDDGNVDLGVAGGRTGVLEKGSGERQAFFTLFNNVKGPIIKETSIHPTHSFDLHKMELQTAKEIFQAWGKINLLVLDISIIFP